MRFEDYSPTESLFADAAYAPKPAAGATTNATHRCGYDIDCGVESDEVLPTDVLGVDIDADWNTIRSAHRKLLAQLHPDRFVTADERTQSDAAERLAAINIAYHELERTRRAV